MSLKRTRIQEKIEKLKRKESQVRKEREELKKKQVVAEEIKAEFKKTNLTIDRIKVVPYEDLVKLREKLRINKEYSSAATRLQNWVRNKILRK